LPLVGLLLLGREVEGVYDSFEFDGELDVNSALLGAELIFVGYELEGKLDTGFDHVGVELSDERDG
jgi:hypothetical protein